jgi:hypothetical protein
MMVVPCCSMLFLICGTLLTVTNHGHTHKLVTDPAPPGAGPRPRGWRSSTRFRGTQGFAAQRPRWTKANAWNVCLINKWYDVGISWSLYIYIYYICMSWNGCLLWECHEIQVLNWILVGNSFFWLIFFEGIKWENSTEKSMGFWW